jgi:LysM repeat protein
MLSLKIPKSKITKIKPVLTMKINGKYESMQQVKDRVGCDYIINAGTYNMTTYALDSGLKIDGKVLKEGYHGFGTKDEKTLEFIYGGNGMNDFFGAFHDIIRGGKYWEETKMNDKAKRGRTGIGFDNDSVYITVIGDKDNKYTCTSTDFMTKYFLGKCDYAINLDGGGSSQWIAPDSRYISGRLVAWYLCIWVDSISTSKVNAPTPPVKIPAPGVPLTTYITHTVAKGETLGSIARRYGTSYQKIAADNGITNINLIHVGQKLKVYRGVK